MEISVALFSDFSDDVKSGWHLLPKQEFISGWMIFHNIQLDSWTLGVPNPKGYVALSVGNIGGVLVDR